MLRLLNELNPWLLALIVVGVAELYATGLMLLCRRRWGTDRLSLNNEVAGFKYAVIGVFYAVLLGFVVVAVWEDYRDTENAISSEAKALVDLHQVSYALPEPDGELIRKRVVSYIDDVRDSEWHTMGEGRASPSTETALKLLRQAILEGTPQQAKDIALYHHILDLLTVVSDNRNERLAKSDGSVPSLLWFVLIAGALITLGYPSFFGTSNLAAQILMTAALAALVALTFLVALLLDYPFTGDIGMTPAAFENVLLEEVPPRIPPP
jgi:hypothetical protein